MICRYEIENISSLYLLELKFTIIQNRTLKEDVLNSFFKIIGLLHLVVKTKKVTNANDTFLTAYKQELGSLKYNVNQTGFQLFWCLTNIQDKMSGSLVGVQV